jgi:hypothetical protein
VAVNRARSSTKRKLLPSEAKAKVVAAIRDGVGVREAMALVDRAEDTYKDWRKNDPEFARQVDDVRRWPGRRGARTGGGKVEVPDFPEFCAEYLDMPMPASPAHLGRAERPGAPRHAPGHSLRARS